MKVKKKCGDLEYESNYTQFLKEGLWSAVINCEKNNEYSLIYGKNFN